MGTFLKTPVHALLIFFFVTKEKIQGVHYRSVSPTVSQNNEAILLRELFQFILRITFECFKFSKRILYIIVQEIPM